MKKLLFILISAMLVVLTGCETTVVQYGVVEEISDAGMYGYKYKVVVKNIRKEGIHTDSYTLYTDNNYHVGDTVKIN